MLKPCPFCGREPELVEADIGDPGDSFTKWNVFCPTGAPQCWITPQTGFMLSERAAIAAWNTRADEERIRLEAIPAVLCDICKQPSKGIKIRCGDQSVSVCQRCIDRWHKGAAGPFGTRQLYSVSPDAPSASQ